MPSDQDRLAREQEFHDARFGDEARRPADRFYGINRSSDAYFRECIGRRPAGTEMLDYGCGGDAYAAIEGARHGLKVTAIDISPVAVEEAREHARAAGVEDLIDFRVMNAEALEIPDAAFDYVCGLGVIHHLEIDSALREVTRVMRPDAGAMFSEPMGHNPLVNLYRRRTPSQRTVDEHPIVMDDLRIFEAHFASVDARYFHLLGLLAIPLLKTRYLEQTVAALDRLDQPLLRTRAQRWAWNVVIELAGPRRVASAVAA